MKNTTLIAFAAGLALLASGCTFGQSYQVGWYSVNSGGGTMAGSSLKLNGSFGQAAAGLVKNVSFLHWVGFWAGEVRVPTVAPTVGAAKILADGTFASVSGKIAVSTESDFSDFFYLEEPDRSNGIRVAFPAGAVSGLLRGRSIINAIGTMGTTTAGERQIAASVIVIASINPLTIGPLGIISGSIGGADLGTPPLGQHGTAGGVGLNNVGLLIRTWGRVRYVDSSYMLISNGSRAQVTVDTTRLANLPSLGDYVAVIGVSSLGLSGVDRVPLVLPLGDPEKYSP